MRQEEGEGRECGVVEYWSAGALECWSAGVPVRRRWIRVLP